MYTYINILPCSYINGTFIQKCLCPGRVRNRGLLNKTQKPYILNCAVGRDSSVGIATCYGLGGPGIESLLGLSFPTPAHPKLLYDRYNFLFQELKRLVRGVDHTPPI